MKSLSIGIIAEYNPFHKGHKEHLEALKNCYPKATLIILMSGPFVQRGEPAVFDKFFRAKCALHAGAHLIIEIPSAFSVINAEQFAYGGIRLLHRLGIQACSFGAENNSLKTLRELALLHFNKNFQASCRSYIQEGLYYGAALRKAHIDHFHGLDYLTYHPNTLLAIEYIKSAYKDHLPIEFIPIHRKSSHHNGSLQAPSSSFIRRCLYTKKDVSDWLDAIPMELQPLIQHQLAQGLYTNMERYNLLVSATSRMCSSKDLYKIYDFEEGLENRWYKSQDTQSYEELIESVKSKRYSYSRLRRMGAYVLLKRSKKDMKILLAEGPLYGRILGFTQKGQTWLNEYQGSIPLVDRWGKFYKKLNGPSKIMANWDLWAQDIHSLTMHNQEARKGRRDFIEKPYISID